MLTAFLLLTVYGKIRYNECESIYEKNHFLAIDFRVNIPLL
ncbi:hypothetical protein BLGI_1667 [Brevibacillus laterosporus GI-9]|nr:hypothetical protein BLGI_1667 [Brevibacillus laterosporus GI-9]